VKIDDREVPAAIVAHWKQALGGLPDAVSCQPFFVFQGSMVCIET
jgi:hypothetical protein